MWDKFSLFIGLVSPPQKKQNKLGCSLVVALTIVSQFGVKFKIMFLVVQYQDHWLRSSFKQEIPSSANEASFVHLEAQIKCYLKHEHTKCSCVRPFLKEFRVVGQICHEGMDESGILPKARYAMTVGHCLEQQEVWRGAVSPQWVQDRALVGVQEAKSPEAPAILQYKVSKKSPPQKKIHFLGTFYLCAAYKLKGKIHLN